MNKKYAVAEIEVVYHNKKKASERPCVLSASEAYGMFLESWHMGKIESQEEMKILLLDIRLGCLGISSVGCGTLSACEIDVSLIFAMALKARAAHIIMGHNHPSGCPSPSDADIRLTAKCKEVGALLGIPVSDHIIVTKEGYYSFAEKLWK